MTYDILYIWGQITKQHNNVQFTVFITCYLVKVHIFAISSGYSIKNVLTHASEALLFAVYCKCPMFEVKFRGV